MTVETQFISTQGELEALVKDWCLEHGVKLDWDAFRYASLDLPLAVEDFDAQMCAYAGNDGNPLWRGKQLVSMLEQFIRLVGATSTSQIAANLIAEITGE